MATSPTGAGQSDALASLEERILRAVQLVTQLRQEKERIEKEASTAIAESKAAVTEATELRAENARLLEEVESLRAERKEVRARIEKLLGQMDTLAS